MKESPNARFLRIFRTLETYIDTACMSFGRGFHHITAEDLKQDCAEKLLKILTRKKYALNDYQLGEVFKHTVYNLLKDTYRYNQHRQHERLITPSIEDEERHQTEPESPDLADDNMAYADLKDRVMSRLNTELERNLFQLMLYPDKLLVGMATQIGSEMKIFNKHYAERLGVSPATVSRTLNAVQEAVHATLDDREDD